MDQTEVLQVVLVLWFGPQNSPTGVTSVTSFWTGILNQPGIQVRASMAAVQARTWGLSNRLRTSNQSTAAGSVTQ